MIKVDLPLLEFFRLTGQRHGTFVSCLAHFWHVCLRVLSFHCIFCWGLASEKYLAIKFSRLKTLVYTFARFLNDFFSGDILILVHCTILVCEFFKDIKFCTLECAIDTYKRLAETKKFQWIRMIDISRYSIEAKILTF